MGVSVLPGPKPMQTDIMQSLYAIGRYEQQRQDMQMRDALFKASTEPLQPGQENNPNARWNHVMGTMANYQPQYGSGIVGAFQRFGAGFSPPSEYKNQLGDMFLAQATPQAQAKLAETQAQAEYYKQPRNAAGGLFARDEQGNMRPLLPGETPLEGETVVRPSARAETDPDVRRRNRYEAAANIQAALGTATDEKDRAWWRKELDRLQQDEGTSATPAAPQPSASVEQVPAAQPWGEVPFPNQPTAAPQQASGGQRTQIMQMSPASAGQSQGTGGGQLFGSGGGLAGFGNGVAAGFNVGNWNNAGSQTPSGTDESGRVSTMKAQEGGGVIVTGRRTQKGSANRFVQLMPDYNNGKPLPPGTQIAKPMPSYNSEPIPASELWRYVQPVGAGGQQQSSGAMSDFNDNLPPQVMQMIQQALANGYTLDQIKQTKEVQPYLKGAR